LQVKGKKQAFSECENRTPPFPHIAHKRNGQSSGEDSLTRGYVPKRLPSCPPPVLDAQGKVVGVAVATFRRGQNLNFAIPVSYLTALLSQVSVG
ncbi:MAG TPA: hypothetical protein VG028_12695, partial [Terriglobia bacterium]|nr:hypothetical protein [Terriglobia bacterium]